ncbi:MAG: ABC transporter permease [Ferruginibacter sp.]|nr:ABC transporter permease [Ferruginibacter sp.]
MWIFTLAWKNIWRNKSRTIIVLSAIAFASIISLPASSLKEGIFQNLISNIVGSYSGHIQIHQKGYWQEQTLENGFVSDANLTFKIRQIPEVEHIANRLESFALISSGEITKGAIVLGVDSIEKFQFTRVCDKLIRGIFMDSGQGLLLSEGLSNKMKKNVNDTVVLIGQGYRGSIAADRFIVSGIIRLPSPKLNSGLLVMPLTEAQHFFLADSIVTTTSLLLKKSSDLNQTAHKIRALMNKDHEVMTWEEIMPDIKQHIQTDSINMRIVQLILYMLVGFGIFSTIVIMMSERRAEHGMLLALGMSKLRLQLLLITESLYTVMLGSLLGLLLGAPLVFYLHKFPLRISGAAADAYAKFGFEPIFPTSTDFSIFLYQSLMVFIIGTMVSLYPLSVVHRMKAIFAMKK